MSPFDEEQFRGLSEKEAHARLEDAGYNELPSSQPRSVLRIALEMLREPMLLLLVAAGIIYLLLGDIQEAVVLCAFVWVVIGIDLYQKRKTERALDALRDLSSPRALVIRDGERKRIAGREVVTGDIVILNEGDRVPADAILVTATNLMIDESLLTGESVPVRKLAGTASTTYTQPGGDDLPFVYSGALIVHGSGIARVTQTGIHTELGKIGATLKSVSAEPTLLEKDTRRLVRAMATVGLSLCALFVVIYGATRGDWLRGFLAALAMAMSVLPEELPVVLTVFLALGARRLSRVNVLTRTGPAIETLGSTTVLCVDKTGTLTVNQMAVAKLYSNARMLDVSADTGPPLDEDWHDLVEYAILASHSEALDPMDRAIRKLGERSLSGTEHLHSDWSLVRQYPLAPKLLAISHVWKSPDGFEYVIAAKGAPEAITDLCHLPEAAAREVTSAASALAGDGLRVLGVAKSRFRPAELPSDQHDFAFEFVGLVALADPVRPSVPGAVLECQDAGIRVVMITGDYPATALNIAKQIGLSAAGEGLKGVMNGSTLRDAGPAEMEEMAAKVSVFARAVPEQKLQLVKALKANGEVVAMTGDGVNDAPALKAAHIGIAMGARGTDVAREASDLVLLDDDFASIVKAVRVGRRIFDNLKKATAYILAIHVPIAGLSFLPVLFGWPVILGPVHIAFLELIIDPACSIAFEAEEEEPGIMRRPPRASTDRLFERRLIALSLLQGLGMLIILLGIFTVSFYRGHSGDDTRALTFTSLVVTNLALIIANRSWSRSFGQLLRAPNPALWVIIGGALAILPTVLYVPFLRNLFHFSTLHADDLALCIGAGCAAAAWFELLKFLYRRHSPIPSGRG